MLLSRNSWSKKLQRIIETRNIEFFVLTSLIQFLVMIFFYLRLWNRFTIIIHSNDSDGCLNYNYVSSNNYPASFVLELLFLVLFQVFQFNFALNAVVTQYCAQVSIIALMNGIVSLYGFIHLLEIRRIVIEISTSCAITPDPQYLAYDVPFIFSSLVFAITMGYFAYKVRRDLSGRIYKKIGLDMTMQVFFKIRLIFMMLMKLNFFFMVVTTIMTTFLFIYITNEMSSNVILKALIIIQFFVAFVQFAAQYVVHRAVPKESFPLMKLFNFLWCIVLVDWFIFLIGSVILAAGGAWIFLYFTVPYCYMGIITLIYAWKTTDTFNQGLREYVGLRLNRNKELIIKIEDVEDYRPRRVSSKMVNNYQTDEIKKPDDVLIFKTPDDAMVDNDNYQTDEIKTPDEILILKKPDDALL